MVRFSLQRVCWRGIPSHITRPCIRTASHWTASAAERKQRADRTRIETLTAKWQPHWDQLESKWNELRNNDKGTAYVLPMFPYPSGTLHLGHLRVYTISDVLARFKHMQGYNVLHPIGWDAFGLPAENAAIERGVHPEKWTLQNIEAMKAQMKIMGGRWDWGAEIRTCDPNFYKHTQRIFLMLHERGLAYQAESLVNYDPIDKTVLANEQVDAHGCSWRSGAKVEKVMLKQWFLKIKEYQEPLLKDLAGLAHGGRWPEKVLAMQRNWIGKSEGATISFDVQSTIAGERYDSLDVFTTRADTLFGVHYIALSCSHPIVQREALGDPALRAFMEKAKRLPADSKEGYLLEHITARNPIAEQIPNVQSNVPVYVAPYVLDDYGSGAVMGVPGHDTRDHAFWRVNAGSDPIRVIVATQPHLTPAPLLSGSEDDKPMTERGYVTADIDGFKGLSSEEAMRKVVATLQSFGGRAKVTENWRLRDWLISRQRYWGTPIPIVHCSSCGAVPVPEQDLPVRLPNLPDSFFNGRKGNPLAEDEDWKRTECPKCGSAAERETDTMDTFMDSSWYFFRFLDPKNDDALLDPRKANKGMPVDLYVGGVEHAILHLLYARFISKFLASTTTWPEGTLVNGEPFRQLITQGMVHGETFTNPQNGRFLRPDELDLTIPTAPRIKANGLRPNRSYEKMSKSKYNGVDPGATIASYGADATRAHMLFQAPVGDVLEWDPIKITGVQRWLQRVLRLSTASWISDEELAQFEIPQNSDLKLIDILQHLLQRRDLKSTRSTKEPLLKPTEGDLLDLLTSQDNALWIKTQQTIANVNESYSQTYSLNTIVSDLMTLTNTIYDAPRSSAVSSYLKWHSMAHLIRMVAPIAPGVAEEAWHLLNGAPDLRAANELQGSGTTTVFAAGFPVADLDIIPRLTRTTKCVVQVDGKRKFEVEIEKTFDSHVSTNRNSMSRWVLDQLLQTDEGKEWLHEGTGKVWGLSDTKEPHALYKFVPSDWNVIIVNDGRLCNLVSPKMKMMKKTKKGGSGPSVPDNNEPAAVSHGRRRELEDMALKQNSNRETVAVKGLGEDSGLPWKTGNGSEKPGTQQKAGGKDQQLNHEICTEQCRSAAVLDDIVRTRTRLSPPLASSVLPLQEVHARVDALMATLPVYLKPHYIPPHIFPIPRPALIYALRKSNRVTLKGTGVADLTPYEEDFASSPTPPTIASDYIVEDISLSDTGISKREQLVMSHNAIFPEQITLLAHTRPISCRTSALLSIQRQSIARKLRKYRIWVNNSVRAKEQAESEDQAKSFATINELEIALGISQYEGTRVRESEFWTKKYVQREADRVQDVWNEIVNLWAGFDGKKSLPVVEKKSILEDRQRPGGDMSQPKVPRVENRMKQKTELAKNELGLAKEQEKDDKTDKGDWMWLVGEDPPLESKERIGEKENRPLKWK